MRLLAFDPSFSRTGITVFLGDKRELHILRNESQIGEKSFNNTFHTAYEAVDNIIGKVKRLTDNIDLTISEIPPPQASFSSGLYMFDSLLLTRVLVRFCPNKIYTLYPTFVAHVIGTRSCKKSDSVILAKTIIEILKKNVIEVKMEKGLCHDEAESVIFMARLFCIVYPKSKIVKQLITEVPRLVSEKEKLFYPWKG